MTPAILWPMIAMVALTAVVWVLMYRRRLGEIRRRRIHPQKLATRESRRGVLEDVGPADNFANLFELPVLFYVLCLALAVTGETTVPLLVLAWLFVALRAAHSAIHVTYNRVYHRFLVYVAGGVVLFVMWGVFAAGLA